MLFKHGRRRDVLVFAGRQRSGRQPGPRGDSLPQPCTRKHKDGAVIIGGLEAACLGVGQIYDYWDNKVRRSILMDSRPLCDMRDGRACV